MAVLDLPTCDDAGEESTSFGLTPPLEEVFTVLLLETREAEEDDDDDDADAASAASAACKRHGTRNKADLRTQLGKADPYSLLELDELRWRATAEDIRRSYRRLVLQHHPDKKASTDKVAEEAGEENGDEMFKAITDAFDLLSDPKRRREFDSLDDFDDTLPTAADAAAGGFFEVFGPVFERNARWSERGGAPLLGAEDSSDDAVAHFYNFWFDFQSWRDFADADEYDPADASFREEKRWMERQNEKLRQKRRKEEKARMAKLVEVAFSLDPRVSAMQAREKEARLRDKAERNALKAAERNAAADAKAAVAAAVAAEAAAEAERARVEAAERKRQKESQSRALRRARGRLRSLCKESSLCAEADWELLCGLASAEEAETLSALCDRVDGLLGAEGRSVQAAREVVRAAVAEATSAAPTEAAPAPSMDAAASATPAAKPRSTAPEVIGERRPTWTKDELGLLAKGSNKILGGVSDRWGKIAEFINHFASPSHARTAEEVVSKTRELRKELEKKAAAQRAVVSAGAGGVAPATPAPAKKPAAAPGKKASAGGGGDLPEQQAGAAGAAGASHGGAAAASDWNPDQQRALEQALAKFPASVEGRWDRIEEQVAGKTRAECVARYKQIVAALKAKKAAATATEA